MIQIFGAVVARLSSTMMTRNQVAAQERNETAHGSALLSAPTKNADQATIVNSRVEGRAEPAFLWADETDAAGHATMGRNC